MNRRFINLPILLLALFCVYSCKDDAYVFPSVQLELATIQADEQGMMTVLHADNGADLEVVHTHQALPLHGDEWMRVLVNYEVVEDTKADIYSIAPVFSSLPIPRPFFPNEVYTDPIEMQSVWMGRGFLNMVMLINGQDEAHLFEFVEDSITINKQNIKQIYLSLSHQNLNPQEGYTQRYAVSAPIEHYVSALYNEVQVYFSFIDTKGEREKWGPYTYINKN